MKTNFDEATRLQAVQRFDILDSEPDVAFDRITALSARRFEVPISLISIVDENRIWFKSKYNLPVAEIERSPGLCASAIMSDKPYIINDATSDIRSKHNPLVTGDFGLRFYAAIPLVESSGCRLGTLNVIDFKPRSTSENEITDLTDLAGLVMDHMELRLSARRAVDHSKLMAREIDHRVMNSLQFISALLTLQSRQVDLGNPTEVLAQAASRVAAVAQVHRHFYSDQTQATSCLKFLKRLCADLASILGKEILVSGDDGDVATTSIQPIGLMVNELVTNAAKHGSGTISVRYYKTGVDQILEVGDEGEGLPADLNTASKGLGMQVINGLVRQLDGKLSKTAGPNGVGTAVKVKFPA